MNADKEQVVISMYRDGATGKEIAKSLRFSKRTIFKTLHKHGLGSRKKLTEDERRRIAEGYAGGIKISQLCEQFGCSDVTIFAIVKRYDVKMRRGPTKKNFSPATVEEIVAKWKSGRSTTSLAEEYGITHSAVRYYLVKNGVPLKERLQRRGLGRKQDPFGYWRVIVPRDSPYLCMANKRLYVLEHRLVMAKYLGRPLKKAETVHHIDGNRSNNSIENLQLRQGKHGSGQCWKCNTCGSCDVSPTEILTPSEGSPDWVI